MNNMTSLRKQQGFFSLFLSAIKQNLWLGPWVLLSAIALSGCSGAEAPSFSLVGSYFPSWMACAFIGIITAVIARVVFIRVGIDDVLPWRLLVYVCLALAVAFICSLLLFTR
ncbi:YtcA family lipoprotein [Yersinia kristensenii]|uniref:YtcA family lipoprotein n=1 Tax=Yersinia kristensenii TaxID=28152 RepID=UPI0015549B82|nr:YtcA family lipoprotein [Yersinia kristensenii]MDA5473195.1 YtcA family lipoprotein [Yersinia kristensenii]MDA5475970.1 YtcA family lipoprotein [Yersinia kristensenii]MDA5507838.1 YtcA family lipoprotein [Yersinia kristensenii]MDA5523670.1 YtcA family lipoprotein [Yersinia kristensenii]MDR4896961.1 YtcA family lipoprotein [Yersinia kristensenii]